MSKTTIVRMKASQLVDQTPEELKQVEQDRNLEDSKVALTRAIQDKESELRKHQADEDSRVKQFVQTQDPNVLLDKGKLAAITEDLVELKRFLSERY